MKNWALIVNKSAGTRSSEKFWKNVNDIFNKAGLKVDYFYTKKMGHASVLAEKVLNEGYYKIIVMGGDGTFSEVIDGLLKSSKDLSKVNVGLIPFGTGNDWGRYWGLDKNVKNSVKVLAKEVIKKVDVGRINYKISDKSVTRYFINAYGLGFDAKVLALTNKLQHIFKGQSWTYSLAVIMTALKNRSQFMEFKFEDQTFKGLSYTASIGNGCYTGGGIKQTPQAKPDDGFFDVMVMENLNFSRLLSAAKLLFTGKLLEHKSVHLYRTKKFIIKSDKPILSEVDGILQELTNYIEVELIPRKINFVVPTY